jgi:hypothetical protein
MKLASRNKNMVDISGGSLSPLGLSAGGGVSITSGNINPNTGRISTTPVAPKPYVEDVTLANVLGTADILAQRTEELQIRRDKVLATEALLEYEDNVRRELYGYEDENGKFIKGYSQLEGVEANDKYHDFVKSVNSTRDRIINRLNPNARSMALVKLNALESRYLTKAASHNAQQLKVAEKQALDVSRMNVSKNIESRGVEAWEDGSVQDHLMEIADPVTREAEAFQLAQSTIYKIQNDGMLQSQSPEVIFNNMQEAVKAVSPYIKDVTNVEKIKYMLSKAKVDLDKYRKTAYEKDQASRVNAIIESAPKTINANIDNNNVEGAQMMLSQIPQDKWGTVMKKSIDSKISEIAFDQTLTPEMKNIRFTQFFNEVSNNILPNMDSDTETEVRHKLLMARSDMKKKNIAMGENYKTTAFSLIKKDPSKPVFMPPFLTDKQKNEIISMQEKVFREQNEGYIPDDPVIRDSAISSLEVSLLDRKIKPDVAVANAIELFNNNKISSDDVNHIIHLSDQVKKNGKTPAWTLQPEYIAAKSAIEAFGRTQIKPSDKKNPTEYAKKVNVMNILKRKLFNDSRQAYLDGKQFDRMKWLDNNLSKDLFRTKNYDSVVNQTSEFYNTNE